MKKLIEGAYENYSVRIKLKEINHTHNDFYLFQVFIKPGVKVDTIFSNARNVQVFLRIPTFELFWSEANIYLRVSFAKTPCIELLPILSDKRFLHNSYLMPIAIGYDMMGNMIIQDLVDMPHALYVGGTCSGKSTGLMCLILSLIAVQPVNAVNLLVFDIGARSLEMLDGIPHLSHPIVKDKLTGIYVLSELVNEMERRITLPCDELRRLPALVCVIDEYTSLIANLDDKKLAERYKNAINNLLRRGRKAKIHMVLATQNATQEAMQSDIGNIMTRFVFRLSTAQSSKAVIGETGAESLPGRGAMLYKSSSMTSAIRVQGAYVSDSVSENMIEKIKSLPFDTSERFFIPIVDCNEQYYQDTMEAARPVIEDDGNLEFSKIVIWALSQDMISANSMKKTFNLGNRAREIMERLCVMGIITPRNGNKARMVLPQSLEEIPSDTLAFLYKNGVNENVLCGAFAQRVKSGVE